MSKMNSTYSVTHQVYNHAKDEYEHFQIRDGLSESELIVLLASLPEDRLYEFYVTERAVGYDPYDPYDIIMQESADMWLSDYQERERRIKEAAQ